MSKINLLLLVLGLLLLADLTVFSFVVIFDKPVGIEAEYDIVRIGVVVDGDRPEARKVLEEFFREAASQNGFELRPCYSYSYDEAVAAFINGSIDLLIINPACFLQLKKQYNARALMRQRFSREEREYEHAVLVSRRKINDVSETRGFRLTYRDRFAMGGYLVPAAYIAGRLPVPAEQWFSRIDFSGSDRLSLQALLDGRTDLVGADLLSLIGYDLYRNNVEQLNLFWFSAGLPETLICISFQSEYYSNQELIQRIISSLWGLSKRDSLFNRSSMCFEPVDFDYENELNRLAEALNLVKKPVTRRK